MKALLKAKAKKVVIGGRNVKLQEEFVAKLKEEQGEAYDTDKQLDGTHTIDLASLQSVKDFASYVAASYPVVDVLICNAGIMNAPAGVTREGIEQQMGVNCVGHFLLAKLLLPHRTKRIVWVASYGHAIRGGLRLDLAALRNFSVDAATDYDGWRAYQQSKLGNILLAKEFQKRYSPALQAVSLHPGTIYTPLYRATGLVSALQISWALFPGALRGNVPQLFPKLPAAGAATTVTCATLPADQLVGGAYYSNCAVVATETAAARNADDAAAFYEYCDEVTRPFQ